MIYPHECSVCKDYFEVIKSVRDFDNEEYCPKCGMIGIKIIAYRQSFHGAADWDTSHYNPALGRVVRSNAEARKIAREMGLEEIGNESLDKIHKKYDSERQHKIDTRYDDIFEPITVVSK
jgi:hypothetical protein